MEHPPRPAAGRPPGSAAVHRAGIATDRRAHERHAIRGGEALLTSLAAGDTVALTDPEGLQDAVVLVYGADGRADPRVLSGPCMSPAAAALRHWLASGDLQSRRLRQRLDEQQLALEPDDALFALQGGQAAGSTVQLTASGACRLLLLALPHPDGVFGQRAATTLLCELQRVAPPLLPGGIKGHYRLPDLLGDVREEFQVDRSTARAYTVRAGEYVQVIDPYGRQCSDFIAFSQRALDRGSERFIDGTVSRSMVRAGYPQPGLLDKFYDQDMAPLLRVVQDSCGRHDTFALACTARGYADGGYPGHVNCSDNISQALAGSGVAARRAWPAINFFFNTAIGTGNLLVSDEGWSRAGDFVLMRAETDLLCVTTACPDDTTPINGWNPTDVHVRIYPARHEFARAVAYRMTPQSQPVMTGQTGFHPRTSALTRHYRQAREYWVPTRFTAHGPLAEYQACRNAVTVMDMSQLCKFDITGPDAERLLQHCLTRNVRKLAVGQVMYGLLCYPHGGMLDDGTLMRFGANNFRWTGGNPMDGDWLREQGRALALDVFVRSATDSLHNLAIQGPRARELLATLVWTPDTQPALAELRWFRSLIGRVHDRDGAALVVSRTGFTGELGYEVFCHRDDALALWDAVWQAGAALGLLPMGSDALEMLRIESGLVSGGQEFSSETDPFEAGVGFAVDHTKDDDYVGRTAIEQARAHTRRKLVGLRLDGQEVPAHGDGVFVGQARVGSITSACLSPLLGCAIAMARVASDYADTGTTLEVGRLDGQQKRLLAQVHALPFHDPDKLRIRG